MLGTFLWLGTYFSLFVGCLLLIGSLYLRVRIEEKTLNAELSGYNVYTETVKNRFIPFIF